MVEKTMLDCNAPAPQLVEAAIALIDKRAPFALGNFDPENDSEALHAVRAYGQSKLKPLPRFDGVFTTEGSGLEF